MSAATNAAASERLSVTSTGSGPRLVMLHGWGLNSHVWDDVVPALSDRFEVSCVDLPGHGGSPWPPTFDSLTSLAEVIAPHLHRDAIVMGWSLGSMAALQLALAHSESVRALVLVAATARFIAGTDWPHGVEPAVLAQFAAHLEEDHESTVRDFLALQVRGEERSLETLRVLRKRVLGAGAPTPMALRAGLEILHTCDLREDVSQIKVPTLVIAGEYDRLTFPEASRELASQLPRARFALIEKAAHAPFISHREIFVREVTQFLARAA